MAAFLLAKASAAGLSQPLRLLARPGVASIAAVHRRGFKFLTQAQQNDATVPQFMVGPENGFLPRQLPLERLPSEFEAMELLLQDMPINKADGTLGLLHHGTFGDAVHSRLPQYDLSKITDQRLLAALYRDYTFLASSYVLEPCDLKYRRDGDYGLGRDRLPANIAVPLVEVAKKINAKPFMEYALSYALYNYRMEDKSKAYTYDNLHLIRTFHGTESERGFIVVHVQMVANTGRMVTEVQNVLDAVTLGDRAHFNQALVDLEYVLGDINVMMDTMWNRSHHADYMKFRSFIMGTKNQPMFPNGVVYEGVSEEPTFYRGESGANDSIIPTCDNLFEMTAGMPTNPLTEILKDFRTYRPAHHSEWLNHVDAQARNLHVRDYAMKDAKSAVLYLANVDRVREFRMRHWNFTKEYILKHTSHPVATGGSPIVTWLPNQLAAVLKVMDETSGHVDAMVAKGAKLDKDLEKTFETLKTRGSVQRRVLLREVEQLKPKYKNQDPVEVAM